MGMVKVTSLLAKAGSGLRFSFGVRAWTEMEIQCVKGIQRLKLVSSENNSVVKGLTQEYVFKLQSCISKDWCFHTRCFTLQTKWFI